MIDWDAEVLRTVMAVFGEGDPADPASLPIYQPVGGRPFALPDAVFDRAYADVALDPEQGEVTNRKPCLGVRTALFPRPPGQSDTVFIPSVDMTFVVKDVQDDGHGHAKLILMAVKQ